MLNWERVPKFILVNLGPSRSHFSGFGKGAGDSHFFWGNPNAGEINVKEICVNKIGFGPIDKARPVARNHDLSA